MDREKKETVTKDMKKPSAYEEIPRFLFEHPDPETWNATQSLAQSSFLMQIESFGSSHSGPSKVCPPRSKPRYA